MPIKSFRVFGEPVDVLVDASMTEGKSSLLRQVSPPGGGPPPHWHKNEDETFYNVEGDFEVLMNGEWHKLAPGESAYAPRGSVHTFRNAGATDGTLLVFATPGGFEDYLEKISVLSIPDDMPQLLAVSERYGITFIQ